jgi:hypothetical protein
MKRAIRSRLTYANVMATVAVFLALGGGAYAAIHLKKNSVKSKQIKDGQVKSQDLADGGVATQDIADGAVATQNIANGAVTPTELAAGAVGPGAVGPVVVRQANKTAADGQTEDASVQCDPGERAVGGGGRLLSSSPDFSMRGSYPIHADGSVASAAKEPEGFTGWEMVVSNASGGDTSGVAGIVYVLCLQ